MIPAKILSRHYDERAARLGDDYRSAHYRFHRSFSERLGFVREKCAGLQGRRVLDAGCGAGLLTSWLAPSNQVVGLDLSREMLRMAAQKSLQPVQADGFSLPFRDGAFDAVLSMETIQHLTDPLPLLKELLRVAAPGSLVLISSLTRESIFQKTLWHLRVTNRGLFFHDLPALANFLKSAGLEDIETIFSGFPLPLRWNAERKALPSFLSSFWMMSARKKGKGK